MTRLQDQHSTERIHTFNVIPEEEGKRLDRLLADRFPDISRERWKRAIEEGDVKTSKKRSLHLTDRHWGNHHLSSA